MKAMWKKLFREKTAEEKIEKIIEDRMRNHICERCGKITFEFYYADKVDMVVCQKCRWEIT